MRLIYNSEVLKDSNKTLRQYSISNGSTLQLVTLVGWVIHVNDRHNPDVVLDVFVEGHSAQVRDIWLAITQ